jgi:hypothetical protein
MKNGVWLQGMMEKEHRLVLCNLGGLLLLAHRRGSINLKSLVSPVFLFLMKKFDSASFVAELLACFLALMGAWGGAWCGIYCGFAFGPYFSCNCFHSSVGNYARDCFWLLDCDLPPINNPNST